MQIQEMKGIPTNLPPCLGATSHMLIGPHPHSSSTIFPASVPIGSHPFSDFHSVVDGHGDEIPNWFNHQCNENSISFLIGPEFPSIALCFAVESEITEGFFNCHVVISINGSKRLFESSWIILEFVNRLVFC